MNIKVLNKLLILNFQPCFLLHMQATPSRNGIVCMRVSRTLKIMAASLFFPFAVTPCLIPWQASLCFKAFNSCLILLLFLPSRLKPV